MGKILLAGMRSAEASRILARRLKVFTPHTITDPVTLKRELDRVRRCGYALDREEITRGIVCIAAPIRNRDGETVAAISVAFPVYISRERGMRDDIRFVTRCAAAITAALQGSRASAQGQAVRTASQTARQRQHG
jgi:DNA-binding IclR family transcriptional regulator